MPASSGSSDRPKVPWPPKVQYRRGHLDLIEQQVAARHDHRHADEERAEAARRAAGTQLALGLPIWTDHGP